MDRSTIKWDQQLRFRHIEVVALWEGRLTTRHLCQTFGIGRQQASRDINHYLSLAPTALKYDTRLKGYKPSPYFKPRFSQGDFGEYLQLLKQQRQLTESGFELLEVRSADTELVIPPQRQVDPAVVRQLLTAARTATRVRLLYASIATGNIGERVFVPHTLVHDGYRWHLRGYCEQAQHYLDLVLSRLRGQPKLLYPSDHTQAQDAKWNRWVRVTLEPNPQFSDAQREVIAIDYGMEGGELTLTTREALLDYHLRRLQITTPIQGFDPASQLLVVKARQPLSRVDG
ncbi:WYL domain-containing protein [Ferrimonas sediminicola]|uniref:WYL domain-containing protein n=1 Tax=Ferrimonas sediminicola TaxID=2569538 RepID=A0A4U1BHG3_9GAMM|nr:WYL domain-containing protein [Ferrimonas sediminicola]TKB50477.1 WYL domain-containing protein [Ferrimonas sediminicola]